MIKLKSITKLVIFLSYTFINFIQALEFPETQLLCPSVDNISGHAKQILSISHIPNSTFYVSGDLEGKIILADVRNGEAVMQLEQFVTDSDGIQSIVSNGKGDLVVLSKVETKAIYSKSITTDSSKNQRYFGADILKLYDQKTNQFINEIITIYIDATLMLTQIYVLTDDYVLQAIFQITVNPSTPSPAGKSPQPTVFVQIQNAIGIDGQKDPVNIIVGYTQTNQVYACLIPNKISNQMADGGYWNPQIYDYAITSIGVVQSSSIIAIQNGAKTQTTTTYANFLVFLDITKLQIDTSTSFSTSNMYKNPIGSINTANSVTLIYNFKYNNEEYTAFVMTSSTVLVIYKVSELIAAQFTFNNAIKLQFTNAISRIRYIDIPDTTRFLVGFTKGNVIQFDFKNYISTSKTTASTIPITQYSFEQASLGLQSTVNSFYLDTTKNSLTVLSNTYYKSVLTIDYSTINLNTNAITSLTNYALVNATGVYNQMIKPTIFISFIQTKMTFYGPKTGTTCPQTFNSGDIINTPIYNVFFRSGSTNFNGQINLNTNIFIQDYITQSSFSLNNIDYAVLFYIGRDMIFSNYCVYNPTGNPPLGKTLTTPFYIHILIFNMSAANLNTTIVYNSALLNIPVITSNDNPKLKFKSLQVDSKMSITLEFTDQIVVIKPYLDSGSIKLKQTLVTAATLSQQPILINFDQKLPISSIISFFYIPTTSYIMIQFKIGENNKVYSSIVQYNQDWTSNDINYQLLSIMVSQNSEDQYPQVIQQLQYFSDLSQIVCYISGHIITYQMSLTDFSLKQLMNIKDIKTSTDDSFIVAVKLTNNYILKIEPNQRIQKINLQSCYTNNCIQQKCEFKNYVKQSVDGSFSDIFLTNNSSYLSRSELLDISILKLFDLKDMFYITSINYSIFVEKNSNIQLKNRYVDINSFGEQSFFSKNTLNLKIRSVDQTLNLSDDIKETFQLTNQQTLNLENYQYISLKNIQWKMSTPSSFFKISNPYFIMDNVKMSKTNNDMIITQFIQTATKNIKELLMMNSKYENDSFVNEQAIIQVNQESYKITLKNLIFEKNSFTNTNLIYSQNPIILNIVDFQFNSNIIVNSDTSIVQINQFIVAQTVTILNANLNDNIIENTILFGINSYVDTTNWYFQTLKIANAIFLITKPDQSILMFDGQLAAFGQVPSEFKLENSSIQKTTHLVCDYSQYKTNKCLNESQNTPENGDEENDDDMAADAERKYYLFALDFIQKVTINEFKDIDNLSTFLNHQKPQKLVINKYYCGNTALDIDIVDSSCIYLSGHSQIDFTLSQSKFYNKNLNNNYLIQITSDMYSKQKLNKVDGKIIMENNRFEFINLSTLSSFYRSSTIYIQSLQQLNINYKDIIYTNITLNSPQRLFYTQSSCLLMDAPFSIFSAESSQFLNFKTYSPSSSIYANVAEVKLNSCHFDNNNYDLADNIYNGGYLEIQSNKFSAVLTNFTQGVSKIGTGVILTPSSPNPKYIFESCIFQNLISLQQGSAVYLGDAQNSTSLIFKKCEFNNLASNKGSVLWVQYNVQSKNKPITDTDYPLITFESCNTTNIYAVQGGFIYSSNTKINLDNHSSLTNNPNKQNMDTKVFNYIKDLETIGEYITLESTIFNAVTFKAQDHSTLSYTANNGQPNIVFLSAWSKSSVTFSQSVINNCKFSDSGFIKIVQSDFKLTDTNITDIMYTQYSSRILTVNLNLEIQQKISTIMVSSKSIVDFQNVIMKKMSCLGVYCSGGAIVLQNSGGKITNSTFDENASYTNGGSISILNLDSQMTIEKTYLINSLSLQGNGGGLSFLTDQIINQLFIINSFIENNLAQQGGGVYFEFQKEPLVSHLASLVGTTVKKNEAQVLGGGIYYQGYSPYIEDPTLVSQNSAKSKFGQDSFSYPVKIVLNSEQSLSETSFNFKEYKNLNGETVYKFFNQVSGTALPNLIFQLIDENGSLLDSSYLSLISESVSLKINKEVQKEQNNFVITSSITEYLFYGQFNVTNLILTGTPGTNVFLVLTSSSIKPTQAGQSYRLLLEIEFRPCERGEIFTKYIETSISSSNTYYKCAKCQQGTYSLAYPDIKNPIEECNKCNSNAFCPGGDVIDLNYGYWRINDQTDNIMYCINAPQNCLGGQLNNTCSAAHTGPLCESCDIENDYSQTGNFQCGQCGDQVANTFKILGLMIFYIISAKISVDGVLQKLLEMYTVGKVVNQKQLEEVEQNSSILLKLILNYFQIIMVLTTFQISIPAAFNGPVDVIASPTTQILYSFECFFYQLEMSTGINMIYIQVISNIVLPVVCLILFFVSGSISFRKDPYKKSFYLNTSFLYCLMYFQPSIFKNAISVLTCRKIGNIKYIQFNVLYECDTDQYDLWSLSLVIPIILVVSFMIPALLAIIIYKSRNHFVSKRKYIFMTGEYKQKTWFWEFIKMYMKLTIMCCLIFYEYDIPNKILFIFFIITFYGFLLFYFKPYKSKIYNKVDILQTFIQGVSVYLGFVAYQNINNVFWWLISLLIIAVINTVFIIWSFKLLTVAYITKAKSSIENMKLFFVKFMCCRRYFYNNNSRKYYLKKRWINSIITVMKKKNLINHWTGKLKINKDQVFPVLQGKIEADDIQLMVTSRKKTIFSESPFSSPHQSGQLFKDQTPHSTHYQSGSLFKDQTPLNKEYVKKNSKLAFELKKIDTNFQQSQVKNTISPQKTQPKTQSNQKAKIEDQDKQIEFQNLIDPSFNPASPNMSEIIKNKNDDGTKSGFEMQEEMSTISEQEMDENIQAQPDNKYLQELSPRGLELNSNFTPSNRLISGKKLIDQDYYNSKDIEQSGDTVKESE